MTYVDASAVDRRPNCPLTYVSTSTDFGTITVASGTAGVDGVYRIALLDTKKETPGIYTVDITGQAKDSSVTHTVTLTLRIKNLCAWL